MLRYEFGISAVKAKRFSLLSDNARLLSVNAVDVERCRDTETSPFRTTVIRGTMHGVWKRLEANAEKPANFERFHRRELGS